MLSGKKKLGFLCGERFKVQGRVRKYVYVNKWRDIIYNGYMYIVDIDTYTFVKRRGYRWNDVIRRWGAERRRGCPKRRALRHHGGTAASAIAGSLLT